MRPLHIALVLGLFTTFAASFSDLEMLRIVPLHSDTHHVQGIDSDGRRLWVTSVDKTRQRGYLQEFLLASGEHLRTIDVTRGERYHPGGMAADGASLWLPVAEYRKASSAVIQKRSTASLEVEFEFPVTDHIGCIAVVPDGILGANWDSRDFYVWDRSGKLLRKVANPTPNAYQDMKFVDGKLVAGGLLPEHKGAIDWLEYPSLKLLRRVTIGETDRGVPFTSEGMTIRGGHILLLPEDSPSRLFEFRLTAP